MAGITITMLFSDNGIITKAREAADAVNQAQGDTLNGLNDLEGIMGDIMAPNTTKGAMVDIKEKYAKYTDGTSSGVVPIPGGYGVVKDSTTGEKNTIASGLVISDLANDTLDNELIDGKRGNQFVWVPVSSTQLADMYGIDSNGKKRGKLYEFGSKTYNSSTSSWEWMTYDTPKALNWTETEATPKVMTITSTTDYREPDILRATNWGDASTGTVDANCNGISQLKTVVGIATTGTEATENANVLKNWEKELQDKFDEMIVSVQKYGGFYIGRYETSGLSSADKETKATVQKGGTVGNANWYYQYQEIKNMAKDNKNITTSMIWGCQFDRTLEWIVETNLKADGTKDYELIGTKSNTWGNYSDSTGAAATGKGSIRTSGYNPAWQKNHIYDLAGNADDWNIEAIVTYHRGTRRRQL